MVEGERPVARSLLRCMRRRNIFRAPMPDPPGQNGDAGAVDLTPLCGQVRVNLRMGNADPRCTHICTKARVGLYVPTVGDRPRPARTQGLRSPGSYRESRI